MKIKFGNAPVPWTVSWSDEFPYFVDRCQHSRMLAIRQPQHHTEDRTGRRPIFANPNFDRQRKAVILGLCDLCARPLKGRTAVSLSQIKFDQMAVGGGTGIVQVEPMMHRECAVIARELCPEQRKYIAAGTDRIRQVTRWRPQLFTLAPQAIAEHVPDYAGPRERIVGYAKVELLQWVDRDADWLGGIKAAA